MRLSTSCQRADDASSSVAARVASCRDKSAAEGEPAPRCPLEFARYGKKGRYRTEAAVTY